MPSRSTAETTKYLRVRDELASRVQALSPGQPLPPERELAGDLGVARMTLRKAADALVAEGRLVRRQGSGTFVAPSKVSQRLSASSFSEDMRARGLRPGARTLSSTVTPAAMLVASCLGIAPSAPTLHVTRLRLADDVPMALEDLHVPCDLVPGLTGRDLVDRSFYEVLSERYGLVMTGGTQTVEPTLVEEAESEALEVPLGAPAFLFERTSHIEGGRVIEFVRSVYRGDRYRIIVDIFPPASHRRPSDGPARMRPGTVEDGILRAEVDSSGPH
ncbi:MAG: GntR family transcriptional regulator [Actinomycetota bacterium]|nr:GntR family transcriptional regulator [Actinomycetota bacterium]